MDIKNDFIGRKVFIFLVIIVTTLYYNTALTFSDQHIPPQEQQPVQTESEGIPSPKQLPSTQDTDIKFPQQTEPSQGTEFPTKIEVPQKLPSTRDLKDIEIKQPSGSTELEQPIPVTGVEIPSQYTPVKPTQPSEEIPQQIVYKVKVCDKITNELLSGADVELSYFGNKLIQKSNKNGEAEFTNLYPIEAATVEVKKQGYEKSEISTSIPVSRTDKICVGKELIVAKPTEPPVVYQPKSPASNPGDTEPPSEPIPPPSAPVIGEPPSEQPKTAIPPHKKDTNKGDHPHCSQIDIDRMTKDTGRRSDDLISVESPYPVQVVAYPGATQAVIDNKIGLLAGHLKTRSRKSGKDNEDDEWDYLRDSEPLIEIADPPVCSKGAASSFEYKNTLTDNGKIYENVLAYFQFASTWSCDDEGDLVPQYNRKKIERKELVRRYYAKSLGLKLHTSANTIITQEHSDAAVILHMGFASYKALNGFLKALNTALTAPSMLPKAPTTPPTWIAYVVGQIGKAVSSKYIKPYLKTKKYAFINYQYGVWCKCDEKTRKWEVKKSKTTNDSFKTSNFRWREGKWRLPKKEVHRKHIIKAGGSI